MPFVGFADAALALPDFFGKLVKLLFGLLLLGFFFLGLVDIHEWKTYIRFGHDERVGLTQPYAPFLEVAFEYLHRFAYGVAGCAEGVYCGVGRLYGQFAYKLPDQPWWPPSVNGEDEPCTFVLADCELARAVYHIRYEYQLVVGRLGKSFGSPSCIACA